MREFIKEGKITPDHFKVRIGMYKSCMLNIKENGYIKIIEFKYKDLCDCLTEAEKSNENNILIQAPYKFLDRRISMLKKIGYKSILISEHDNSSESDIINFVVKKSQI